MTRVNKSLRKSVFFTQNWNYAELVWLEFHDNQSQKTKTVVLEIDELLCVTKLMHYQFFFMSAFTFKNNLSLMANIYHVVSVDIYRSQYEIWTYQDDPPFS